MVVKLELKRTAAGVPTRLLVSCSYEEKYTIQSLSRGCATWLNKEGKWSLPLEPPLFRDLCEKIPNIKVEQDAWDYSNALRQKQELVLASTQNYAPVGDAPLWDFQQASVRFLFEAGRCILAHQMGTGKTVITSTAIKYGGKGKILVISPNSVKWSWVDHMTTWGEQSNLFVMESGTKVQTDDLDRAHVLYGSLDKRHEELNRLLNTEKNYVLMLNYDQLRLHSKLLQHHLYDVLIVDEAHRVKNRKALRTQSIQKVARQSKDVWLLTGTPVRNDYTDYWSLLNILDPIRFSSYWNFVNIYMKSINNMWGGTDIIGLHDEKEFNSMLSTYMFRKTKEEVMPHMPKKIYADHRLRLNEKQANIYRRMEKEFCMHINKLLDNGQLIEDVLKAPTVVSQIIRLRQICLTPAMIGGPPDSAKLDAFGEIMEDYKWAGTQVIVYCTFRAFLPFLAQVLNKLEMSYAEIVGGQSAHERDQVEKALKAGDVQIILGTLSSMGEGMNLQAATEVIFTNRDWVPANNEQGEDRIHRGKIKISPTIRTLYHPGTVETDIRAVCARKEKIINETAGRIEVVRKMLLRNR